MMLLSQGLAAQSPSRVPIHRWGFGRHILLPVLQRMQGLAVMKTWAAELSSHCSVGASSAAPPALLRSPPGRWEVGQVPVWGAERCWEPWAGQAGALTTATIGSEWIPLNRAECLGGLGSRGEATAPGQGKNRHRLIPGTSTVCDPDTDPLSPEPGCGCPMTHSTRDGGREKPAGDGGAVEFPFSPPFLCSSHLTGQAPRPPLCPKRL